MDEVKVQTNVVKTAVKLTKSAKMWEEIKTLKMELFSLPGQTAEKYLEPLLVISDDELYLKYKQGVSPFTAIIPALETVVSPKYSVELRNNYIVVYA